MPQGALTASLLALALGGCIGLPLAGDGEHDEDGWTPLPCDPSGAHAVSHDAPLAAGLQQVPSAIAADLASVLGDPLAIQTGDGDPPTWSTALGGSIALSILQTGEFFMAVYRGPAEVDRHVVARLLERWSVDTGTVWTGNGDLVAGDGSDGPAFQMALGLPVVGSNGGAAWSRTGQETLLAVLPFYDLSGGETDAAVTQPAAVATAWRYAACVGIAAPGARFDAHVLGLGILHGSLGYVVAMPQTPALQECLDQPLWVVVDTQTGAVLGSYGEPCV